MKLQAIYKNYFGVICRDKSLIPLEKTRCWFKEKESIELVEQEGKYYLMLCKDAEANWWGVEVTKEEADGTADYNFGQVRWLLDKIFYERGFEVKA